MRLKRILPVLLLPCLLACSGVPETRNNDNDIDKLLTLERKWLEAEFALDTAYISSLIDSTFVGISSIHTTTKRRELNGIYNTMTAMRRDSIFLDSLKLEDAIVNFYDNTAVATFIVHSYKKDKGRPIEKRTRFSDVWVLRNGAWKAVASHGTPIPEGD
jgi:hypothetical protein